MARKAAALARPDLADRIKEFQFRDLRAKAATDVDEVEGITAAQEQLGHTIPTMTRKYVRHRKGKLVKPTRYKYRGKWAFAKKPVFCGKAEANVTPDAVANDPVSDA